MDKDKVRKWAVVLGVVATIVLNDLANIIPFNGRGPDLLLLMLGAGVISL